MYVAIQCIVAGEFGGLFGRLEIFLCLTCTRRLKVFRVRKIISGSIVWGAAWSKCQFDRGAQSPVAVVAVSPQPIHDPADDL